MEAKEILARLEIVKLATTIGDYDTIVIQTTHLTKANSSRLNEIATLLNSKNYRQALYLIKGYSSDMGETESFSSFDTDDGEKVLDIEDMLRMSPLAKETIRDYKRSAYTDDDLEAFSRNIELSPADEYKNSKKDYARTEEKEIIPTETSKNIAEEKEPKVDFIKSIETEVKLSRDSEKKELKKETIQETLENNKELTKALENADEETPLDEISAEVLGNKTKKSRTKVLNKYKALRDKFSRKSKIDDTKTRNETIIEEKSGDKEEKSIDVKATEKLEVKVPNYKIEEKANEKVTSSNEQKVQVIEEQKELKASRINDQIKEARSEKTISNNDKEVFKVKEQTKESKDEIKSKLSRDKQEVQDRKDKETIYAPIPHMEEKFRQTFILYPPLKESEVWGAEVIKFLKNVSKNSFTERDVKIFIDEFDFFLDKRDIAKASQVLLLASATDSKFAQFLLARELFSGKVLIRDLKKSFTIMKHLANQFYPEAVCDLGQFYEYGIGVPKDKKVAIKLYEKSFELGVSRATKHISRLKESNGILSTIFKMK